LRKFEFLFAVKKIIKAHYEQREKNTAFQERKLEPFKLDIGKYGSKQQDQGKNNGNYEFCGKFSGVAGRI
jgi:hypothetical protein